MLTCEKLTSNKVKELVGVMQLSNDAVVRLGERRLSTRIKLVERSVFEVLEGSIIYIGRGGVQVHSGKGIEIIPALR